MEKCIKRLVVLSILIIAILAGSMVQGPLRAEAANTNGYSTATAIPITFGETAVKTWTEDDYYYDCYLSIEVPSAGILSFSITKPVEDDGQYGELYFYIYDSEGELIQEISTYNFNTVKSSYDWSIGLSSGQYYINMTCGFFVSSNNISSSYTVNFTESDYSEIEPNDSMTKANLMTYDLFYDGFIHLMDENDYYKYFCEEDGYIYLHIDNYEKLSSSTTLIEYTDAYGNSGTIYDGDLIGIYDSTYVFAINAKAGYNYINIFNESVPHSYSIMISEDYGDLTLAGSCGANAQWNLSADGTLAISGTGAISTYSYGDSPWYNYRSLITTIDIQEGVTIINNGAFYDCENVETVYIPSSVNKIADFTFEYCSAITNVYYSGNIAEWGNISIGMDNEYLTNAEIHYEDNSVLYGDVNFDNNIDVSDALTILKSYVKLVELAESQVIVADVDGSNVVDVSDALYVLKYYVKLIDNFPIKETNDSGETNDSYEYNVKIYDDQYVAIILVSISGDNAIFSITNNTSEKIQVNAEHFQLDGIEYSYEDTNYSTPIYEFAAGETREYEFCDWDCGNEINFEITNPDAQTFTGIFEIWDGEGTLIENANIASTAIK